MNVTLINQVIAALSSFSFLYRPPSCDWFLLNALFAAVMVGLTDEVHHRNFWNKFALSDPCCCPKGNPMSTRLNLLFYSLLFLKKAPKRVVSLIRDLCLSFFSFSFAWETYQSIPFLYFSINSFSVFVHGIPDAAASTNLKHTIGNPNRTSTWKPIYRDIPKVESHCS